METSSDSHNKGIVKLTVCIYVEYLSAKIIIKI